LRFIGQVVAFAVDDISISEDRDANAELQRQKNGCNEVSEKLREVIETIPCMHVGLSRWAAQFFNAAGWITLALRRSMQNWAGQQFIRTIWSGDS